MPHKGSVNPAAAGFELDGLPTWQAAALRVVLWLSASLGATVCLYWAARSDPAYWWPGITLAVLSVWPVIRSARKPIPTIEGLQLHAHGLRLVRTQGRDVQARSLAWQDIESVEVRTPASPLRGADLRFVLVAPDAGGDLVIAAETARRAGLWLALETYLGDLDEGLMLRALATREERRFVVWRRTHRAAREATSPQAVAA